MLNNALQRYVVVRPMFVKEELWEKVAGRQREKSDIENDLQALALVANLPSLEDNEEANQQ